MTTTPSCETSIDRDTLRTPDDPCPEEASNLQLLVHEDASHNQDTSASQDSPALNQSSTHPSSSADPETKPSEELLPRSTSPSLSLFAPSDGTQSPKDPQTSQWIFSRCSSFDRFQSPGLPPSPPSDLGDDGVFQWQGALSIGGISDGEYDEYENAYETSSDFSVRQLDSEPGPSRLRSSDPIFQGGILTSFVSPRLPTEIWELIIESVTATDAWDEELGQTWYSCALVCRSWVPTSRRLLYRSVYLDSATTATRFMASLTTCRQLGEFVHRLRIDPQGRGADWFYKVLQVLPPILTNLERLEFWALPDLHQIFFGLCTRFTTIKALTLYELGSQSFREIVRIASRAKNLQTLTLYNCRWKSPAEFFTPRGLGPVDIRLNSIPKESHDDAFRWVNAEAFPALKQFSFSVSLPSQTVHSDIFLEKSFLSLQSLDLEIAIDPETQVDNVSFPSFESCINLRDLHIRLSRAPTFKVDHTAWLLRHLPGSINNSLRNLAFTIFQKAGEVFGEKNKEHWKEFDKALSKSLSSLASMEIMWTMREEDEETLTVEQIKLHLISQHQQGIFKQLLPWVYKRGILWCSDEDLTSNVYLVSSDIEAADTWIVSCPMRQSVFYKD
ncbi:hypothetical protein NLI96_g10237 [Meripilus lineatus]|uniref:F-box domain-containing protein n=1 Tax=Meripilus lineatus TaxID=2056292 RepID=A0AAD5Y9H1_9APHY|nr:hypothetical protein NLI96_g10237 [Physisporinus lineatus]